MTNEAWAQRSSRVPTGIAIVVFLIALGLCLPALSQDKKKSDIPDKPKSLAADDKKDDKAAEEIPKGPSANRDDFEVGGRDPKEVKRLQEKIRKLNKSQIEKIDRILTKNPNYRKKADLLFQKAELTYEVLKYDNLLKKAEWLKCLEAADQGTVAASTCKEPKGDYTEALNVYKEVMQQFPGYRRLDEVLFRLGDGLMKAEKKKEGVGFLTKLVKTYPKSKYVPDAHLAIAEFWFDQSLLTPALLSYKEVLKFKNSPLYNYALYKMAWVLYNQKEFRQAVNTFKKVIEAVEKSSDQQKLSFANQALNDLIVSLAEIDDGWKEARDYFLKKRDKEFAHKKLRQMAGLYDANGKNLERIAVFSYLLKDAPTDKRAPDYWEALIDAKKKEGDRQDWEKSVRDMIGYLDPKGKWWGANGGDKQSTNNARLLAEGYLAQLATEYHQRAQKDNDPKLYKQAAKDYALFLEKFPDSEAAYDTRFYYAEILFDEIKDYDKAAGQYQKVINAKPDGEHAKHCQFAILKSYEKLVLKDHPKSILHQLSGGDGEVRLEAVKAGNKKKKDGEDEKLGAAKKKKRTDLYKWEKPFLDASDAWAKKYPKEENTPTVMFVAAEVFRSHGQYDNAVPRYEHIIDFAPKHRYASYAGNSLLECNNELGKWSEIEKWARYLLDNKIFDVTPKDKLQDAIAYAISKKADDLQKEKKFDQAAVEMLRLANEWPDSDLAPGALFNAAAIYEKADKVKLAVANYEKLIKKYPDHELAPEAIFVMGAIFEARTDFERAAGFFERLGDNKKWRDEYEKSQDAIYNAGVIREALEQYDKAIATYEKFIKLYPKSELVQTLTFHIAELYEKAKNNKKAEAQYKTFLKKYKDEEDKQVQALLAIGLLNLEKKGKRAEKDADVYFERAYNAWNKIEDDKKKKKAKPFAAEALFRRGEVHFEAYRKVKISFPLNILQKRAVEKATLQQKAEKVYFDVIELKNPLWTAAAAYRIGQMYKDFSDELYNLPLPEGLPPEAEDEYRASIDELSFPLQEKSLTAFQRALSLALELNAYNEWSAKSAEEMSRLEAETYPITNQEGVGVEHTSEVYLNSRLFTMDDVVQRAEDEKKSRKGDKKGKSEGGSPETSELQK